MIEPHPSDIEIERYVLVDLGPSESPEVIHMETHLLVCPDCLRRGEEVAEFVQAIRDASPEKNLGARRRLVPGNSSSASLGAKARALAGRLTKMNAKLECTSDSAGF
jgi:hypothetical protein